MKLIKCIYCLDWIKLAHNRRWCDCRRCSGLYVDDEVVYIKGPCIPFGVNNFSWAYAINGHLATFEGWFYHTGYIDTPNIIREDLDKYETPRVMQLSYRLDRARQLAREAEKEGDQDEDREAMGNSE